MYHEECVYFTSMGDSCKFMKNSGPKGLLHARGRGGGSKE